MNIEKLNSLGLTELVELKATINDICEDYAKQLTDYQTVSGDITFLKMPPEVRAKHARRAIFFHMLETIKLIIEKKVMEIYDE